jgi:hypothetical protein
MKPKNAVVHIFLRKLRKKEKGALLSSSVSPFDPVLYAGSFVLFDICYYFFVQKTKELPKISFMGGFAIIAEKYLR